MPSRPIFSTPAFSEICSPRPARSSGKPAVTAPNSSETRNGSVNNAFISVGSRFAAGLIQIFDQGQEQQQQRHQHQHIVLRYADPACRALPAYHQCREEQRESDDGIAVEAREKHQRYHQQAERRIPVRPHRAPDAQHLHRTGKTEQAGADGENDDRQPFDPQARMDRRRTVRAENLQVQPKGRPGQHQVNQYHGNNGQQQSAVDRGAEETRQAVLHGEAAGLRHRGIQIAQYQLYQHIREARAQKAHHQGGDDLVDAIARLEQRGHQGPERAHEGAHQHTDDERGTPGQYPAENRCERGARHGGEQKLTVAAQIPDSRAKRHDQSGGDQQQRRHARQRFLCTAPTQQAALEDVAVVAERVLAEGQQNEAADDQRQSHRDQYAEQCGRESRAAIHFRRHAAAAPVMRRRTWSAAASSLTTMPVNRPWNTTPMRSLISSSSSRSVEITITAIPRAAAATIRSRARRWLCRSSPYVGLLRMATLASASSSRASNTFWTLPPESLPTGVSSDGVRMSLRRICSRALRWIRAQSLMPCRQQGGVPISLSTRLVATEKIPTVPSPSRSSVTYRIPRCRRSGTCPRVMSEPARSIRPCCTERWPARTSARCFWPLPSTPAIPSTSPGQSSKLTSCSGVSAKSAAVTRPRATSVAGRLRSTAPARRSLRPRRIASSGS